MGLEGRWVLVTGGTRGIGRTMVDAFAAAGANVAVTSRSAEDADEVADEVDARYDVVTLGAPCDVGDLEDVKGLIRQVAREADGQLHGVVMNAGYPLVGDWWDANLHDMPEEALQEWFDAVHRVDLQGSRFVTWAALPHLLEREGGSLVYVSSTSALAGYKGLPYTEAKAGILGLMRDVARQYGPHGIRANAIAPGNIRTGWMDEITEAEAARLANEGSLKRWGEPDEVARVAVFLVSEMASFVTGQTLIVDGGEEVR